MGEKYGPNIGSLNSPVILVKSIFSSQSFKYSIYKIWK